MKAWYGDAATAENNWCYDWLPKLDKGYDILQVFENMHQGKVNGYICQGFNPLASAPCKIKVCRRPVQAEVSGGHRSAGHGDLGILAESRRIQRRRSDQDPDRGLPPAFDLLCRGGRLAGQLRDDGCNGTGRPPNRPVRPRATRRSWPVSFSNFAKCTKRMAAPSPIRSSTSPGGIASRTIPRPKNWPGNSPAWP